MILTELEEAVLEAMCQVAPRDGEELEAQLRSVRVKSRDNSGVGFFTALEPERSRKAVSVKVVEGVWANIKGFQDPMAFVLFLKDGFVDILEGAAIRDSTFGVDFSTVVFEIHAA